MSDELSELLGELGAEPEGKRARLIKELLDSGCSAEEIADAHRRGRLELLPVERVLASDGTQTLAAIAQDEQVDLDALIALRRALGLPIEPEEPIYGTEVVEQARRLRAYLAAGLALDSLIAFNRVVARAMVTLVGASRDALGELVREEPEDEIDRALRVAQSVEALAPELEQGLLNAFREHLQQLVRHAASDQLLSDALSRHQEVAVAFADLVGFTRLGDEVSPQELSQVATKLEQLAGHVVAPGVTLVKVIGDAVMLVSEDPRALVSSVLDLLAAADGDRDLPAVRAGAAAGPAVQRAGDWYGRTVNLASRLASFAPEGELAADQRLRDLATGCAEWRPIGSHEVRGFDEPVAVYAAS